MKTILKSIITILFLFGVLSSQIKTPKLLIYDINKIALSKKQFKENKLKENPALRNLLKEAEKKMDFEPVSVMEKEQMPPSGDKHDFMSMGPYWWPNPDTENKLPYIRKDGEKNPEINDIKDDENKSQLFEAVRILSLAYFITEEQKYAEHSIKLIEVWFLNSETKMNPNLNFAQSIKGVSEGRGVGIIDFHQFYIFIESIGLLETSELWTEKHNTGMKQWFRDYFKWLNESKNGKEESAAKNNHGTWYAVQYVSIALYLGENEIAKNRVELEKKRLISQIEPDGTQPYELERTTSWNYSAFNLIAFFTLATMGDKVGVDLWKYESADGRSLKKALDYIIPFAINIKDWKYPQISSPKIERMVSLLLIAQKSFNDKNYGDWLIKIFKDDAKKRFETLVF